MMRLDSLLLLTFAILSVSQQIGRTPENRPRFITHECSKKFGCIEKNTSVVLDAQWRDIYDTRTGDSCINENGQLNNSICPTVEACANRCALDAIDYPGAGVNVEDESTVTLKMYKQYQGELIEIGPQIYLLSDDEKSYELLRLLNKETSFTVDVSNLPCGMNGAMYLAAMDAFGGRNHLNPAGASYGTGYCDSQCYESYNFINGVANLEQKGACCNEMDLLEANSRAMQFTVHPCSDLDELYECHGNECGDGRRGLCAGIGCGFNPYGLGDRDLYGLRGRVDTNRPFRVVTQFITDDGMDCGTLVKIRRLYIQDGQTINNSIVHLDHQLYDSLTSNLCEASQAKSFRYHGGLDAMGEAL